MGIHHAARLPMMSLELIIISNSPQAACSYVGIAWSRIPGRAFTDARSSAWECEAFCAERWRRAFVIGAGGAGSTPLSAACRDGSARELSLALRESGPTWLAHRRLCLA